MQAERRANLESEKIKMGRLRNRKLNTKNEGECGVKNWVREEGHVRSCRALLTMIWGLEFIQNTGNLCF